MSLGNLYPSQGYLDKQYKAFQFNYMFKKNAAMDYWDLRRW